MCGISHADLLNAWEQGLNQPPLQRALILLALSQPQQAPEALLQLSIGQRDTRLLRLREHLFGTTLLNTAQCPHCHERLEWESQTTDFLQEAGEDGSEATTFVMHHEQRSLRFRLPNSLDMMALTQAHDPEAAQQALLARCLLEAEPNPGETAQPSFPATLVEAFGEHIERLDPQADIRIQLHCPACDHPWSVSFDISRFLWAEIHHWAQGLLQTISQLAMAYGWREQDILALSPLRRQLYLEMLSR